MGDLLFQDGSVPLKLGEVMSDCAASKGIYGALKLDNLFTIYDFVNLTERLPDMSTLYVSANKTVQDVTLLEDASRQKFVDVIASPPAIDVEALMTEIKDGLASITLTKTINDLEQAASEMSNPTFKDAYTNMANRLRVLDTVTLPVLSSAVANLDTKIQSISLTTSKIMETAGNVLNAVDSMQDFLKTAGSGMVIQSMADYVARIIGFGDQYLDHVQNSLVNSVGSCKVVHDIYRILSESVCQTFLGGLNGYWLSLNVMGLFFIILLILNFKISNYYRAVNDPRPNQDYDLEKGYNSTKEWNARFQTNSTSPRRAISDVISTWFGFCKALKTTRKRNMIDPDAPFPGFKMSDLKPPRRSLAAVICSWVSRIRNFREPEIKIVWNPKYEAKTDNLNNSNSAGFDITSSTPTRRSISDVILGWFGWKAPQEKPNLTTEDVFSVFSDDGSQDKKTANLDANPPRRSISDVISTWFAVFALPSICCNRKASNAMEFDLTTGDVFSVFGSKVEMSDSKYKPGKKNKIATVHDIPGSRYRKAADEKPNLTTEGIFSVFDGDDECKAKKSISDTFKFGPVKNCDANNDIAFLTTDDVFSTFGEDDKKKSYLRDVFCYLPNLLLRVCYSPKGRRSCPVSRCSRSETNVDQVIINMPEMNCENGLPPHLAHVMYVPCLTPITVYPEFKMENELAASGSEGCDVKAEESKVSAELTESSTEN